MINTKIRAQGRLSRKENKGFTLTEIAIVLGIIGVILGAIWVAASGVYANQRVNSANTAVMQIAQGVRALYSTSSNLGTTAVTNLTNPLITANAVPNSLVNGSDATAYLAGPLPGGYTVIEANGDGNGFVIAMTGASRSVCISLLTAIGGTGRDPGLYQAIATSYTTAPITSANALSHTAYAAATTPSALTVDATPALASAAVANRVGGCTGTGTSATHAVQFGFSLK